MTAIPKPYLISLVVFLLGGAFASLLMYYTALAKHLDGLYNESIFLTAAYFGMFAVFAFVLHRALKWRESPQCEEKRECEE